MFLSFVLFKISFNCQLAKSWLTLLAVQQLLFFLIFFSYFSNQVYVYDPKEPLETRGCCVRKRKIWEEYPPAEGHAPLPGKLDAVYYSYQDKMQYFIKDESLWRNKFFDPRQKRLINSVELTGNWYDRWMDICDVQAEWWPRSDTLETPTSIYYLPVVNSGLQPFYVWIPPAHLPWSAIIFNN